MNGEKLLALGASLHLLAACSSSSIAEPKRPSVYECAHGRLMYVHTGEEHATVDFLDHHYELGRRSSSIGLKYTSSEATLIIDEETAVFVTHSKADLQTCRASGV